MARSNAITIKDVAAQLGIAHSTVSRALSGSPLIGEETRRRVVKAATELGYVADASARVMQRGSSQVVGLVVPDVQTDFFSSLTKALAQECAKANSSFVLAVSQHDSAVEERQIRALREARASGIIIYPTVGLSAGSRALLEGTRVVQVARCHPTLAHLPFVKTEDGDSIRTLVHHLLILGHRRIGYIGSDLGLSPGKQRYEGYVQAHADAGVRVQPGLVHVDLPLPEVGRAFMQKLLVGSNPPTAIMAASAPMALGALDAIHQRRLRIPEDISFAGFGDPPWYKLWGPGLTTASLPFEDIARAVFAALTNATPVSDHEPVASLRNQVILRGSTAKPAR